MKWLLDNDKVQIPHFKCQETAPQFKAKGNPVYKYKKK